MKTPLYDCHAALGARIAPFGGWDMPIQYAGILSEHQHTRTRCSIFDICHMGEFEISGPAALTSLERLLTQTISSLDIGQCRYGFLLREDGGVLDDLTCYRLDPERFMLVVNAATCRQDAEWIAGHLDPGAVFKDLSLQTAKLDLQGPTTRADTETALGVRLPDLNYFHFAEIDLLGEPCLVSRTGYTGEWGYEIYFPWAEAVRFWNCFLANDNIKPAGLGARDTLRLEMGYPLYGHELSLNASPVGVSRGKFIDIRKEFTGKGVVARDLARGPEKALVGLQLKTRRAARAHDPVRKNGRVVGEVTSGSFAPSLDVAVALALIEAELSKPGETVDIDVHGTALAAEVVDLPFYKKGTARAK